MTDHSVFVSNEINEKCFGCGLKPSDSVEPSAVAFVVVTFHREHHVSSRRNSRGATQLATAFAETVKHQDCQSSAGCTEQRLHCFGHKAALVLFVASDTGPIAERVHDHAGDHPLSELHSIVNDLKQGGRCVVIADRSTTRKMSSKG